jgi:hypothetical protein
MSDVTLWLTGNTCSKCNALVTTDGRRKWCTPGCPNDNKQTSCLRTRKHAPTTMEAASGAWKKNGRRVIY